VAPTEVRTPAPAAQSLLYAPAAPVKHASLIAEPDGVDPTRVIGRGGVPEALMDAAALPPGTVLADRYRVVRHIGSGAFGVVILVEDVVVHEEIILKFLKPPRLGRQVIQRFVQELRAPGGSPENVIRIHDFIAVGRSLRDLHGVFRASPGRAAGGASHPAHVRDPAGDLPRHERRASRRHRPPGPQARQRAPQ
jgi:hypothetical protein